jgi:hypothetical protein
VDPIEKAIRNALEKGNALDPAFRNRVYVSAEHALSRSLAAHATMPPADKHARIEKLRRIAVSIEQEFAPATADTDELPRQVRPESRLQAQHERSGRSSLEAVRRPPEHRHTTSREAPVDLAGVSAGSNRRLSKIFVYVTVLALAIMLGWLFWTSGILDKADDSGGISTDQTSESSDDTAAPRIGNASDADEGWITIFAPSDAAAIDLSDGLAADLKGDGADAFILLTAPENSAVQSAASIEIGRGVLETLRGKKVVFDIKAKAGASEGAQMSIACDLAGMGECLRTRFRLESQLTDNLVSAQLEDTAPEASGLLSISPDIDGKGRAIEVHSVRVRVDE